MSDDKLPIMFFVTREIDQLRIEGSGSSAIPQWVLTGDDLLQKANELDAAFDLVVTNFKRHEDRESPVPFVFVAKLKDDSTSKTRRREVESVFRTGDRSNLIGLADAGELLIKVDSSKQIETIASRLKDHNQNKFAISCLDTFSDFQPNIIDAEPDNIAKVKLIDFQDYEMNNSIHSLFERKLIKLQVPYRKTHYTNNLPVYRIETSTKSFLDELDNTIEFDMLFSIEPMPMYSVRVDMIVDEAPIETIEPLPDTFYQTLGLLDSGVADIPQLNPWITDKRWSVYPESSIDPGHGTFVAGVALYGDKCESNQWVDHHGIKIFDAAVFPGGKEKLAEDELIANISEAIEHNHEKVKIWNLSISVTRQVSDSKFSDLGIALDDLQTRFNILICKSTGNCNNFVSGRPKERIHEGADSIRSLVVGSVAQSKGPYDIADIDNPSPFSRVGPGPEFIIKPEVSHYGGNAGINNKGETVQSGVKSFSIDGRVATAVGTSFSTPRIASLATGLYQALDEEFDPLLLKSLIIHSASYSEKLHIPTSERTNQLGFGVPKSVSQILYNSPYEATLILRDTLSKGDKIDIMDFPMPKSLIRNGFYTGQITATLVYDPILDPTQGIEYCQSNMDVKFGSYSEKVRRDTSRHNILNPVGREGAQNLFKESLYSKRVMRDNKSDFALRERLLIQYGDKYYPVKKYAVDLSELSEANKHNYLTDDKHWFLFLSGLYRANAEQRFIVERRIPSQDFCLILTIRDPEKTADVYNEVIQALDAHHFWHSSIKLSSTISIASNSFV